MHHLSMENMPRMPCDAPRNFSCRADASADGAGPDARTKSPKMAARYHTLCAIQQ